MGGLIRTDGIKAKSEGGTRLEQILNVFSEADLSIYATRETVGVVYWGYLGVTHIH